jgi:hypothetical protein
VLAWRSERTVRGKTPNMPPQVCAVCRLNTVYVAWFHSFSFLLKNGAFSTIRGAKPMVCVKSRRFGVGVGCEWLVGVRLGFRELFGAKSSHVVWSR